MSVACHSPARWLRPLLAALLAALPFAAGLSLPQPVTAQERDAARAVAPSHALDRVIVGFTSARASVRAQRALGGRIVAAATPLSPLAPEAAVLELVPGISVARAMRTLGDQPGVAYVEPDYRVRTAATADDPWYADGSQWGMYGADTDPHANRFGSGAAAAWQAGHLGLRRIHVAVVDEGVRTDHPDLAANLWTNTVEVADGRDDDGNGYVDDIHGWDFFNDDASVYDGTADDHGTHVAGTIGASGGNGLGVAGVNWQVTIVPVKFLGAAGGYVSGAVRALDYVTDLKSRHGLDLIASNNSWTGGGYSQALADAITRGGDAGILFVAAAGNDGRDVDASPTYPGGYGCSTRADGSARGWDCVVSVGNLEPDGGRHPESNWGAESVDLAAPGTRIVSTHPGSGGYAFLTGTSMAAPHVSGAAALCASLAAAPSARLIREAILGTAAETDGWRNLAATGGRLDVEALVERCQPEPPLPLAAIVVDDLDDQFKRSGSGWSAVDAGHDGHHFLVGARDDVRTAYGAWRPLLPAPGRYRIVAYIPAGATSRAAAYKVRTAGGWVTRVRDQHKRQGTWVGLGIHELTTSPSVRLADLTGEPAAWDRRVAYDALRFVLLEAREQE